MKLTFSRKVFFFQISKENIFYRGLAEIICCVVVALPTLEGRCAWDEVARNVADAKE